MRPFFAVLNLSSIFFTASNLALSLHLRLDEKCNAESFDRTHVTEFKRTSQKLEIPAAVFHYQTEITGATVESPEAAGSRPSSTTTSHWFRVLSFAS